jgi:hypothetical protein
MFCAIVPWGVAEAEELCVELLGPSPEMRPQRPSVCARSDEGYTRVGARDGVFRDSSVGCLACLPLQDSGMVCRDEDGVETAARDLARPGVGVNGSSEDMMVRDWRCCRRSLWPRSSIPSYSSQRPGLPRAREPEPTYAAIMSCTDSADSNSTKAKQISSVSKRDQQYSWNTKQIKWLTCAPNI